MRSSARSRDDGDVIRARLRVLLAEGAAAPGWVPGDPASPAAAPPAAGGGGWSAPDDDPAAERWDDDPDADRWDDDLDDSRDGGRPRARDAGLPAGLGRHRAAGRTARLDPGRPGAWALWTVAVLAAVAVVAWTWLGRPSVDPVVAGPTSAGSASATSAAGDSASGPADPSGPAGASGTVVVSVVGLVASPGLVTLPAGARVADALAAAGGLLPEADPASVNAAAVLSDGQQIAVGVPGAGALPGDGGGGAVGGGPAGGTGPLDLNTATVGDLDALPGIGPVLAQRIVDHRAAHGPFGSVDELDDVSGIGPAIFADLAERVRV